MPPTIETSRDHDEEWLSAWVRRRDHTAFRALVGKYTGLVHGTALRKLGRADWAEEITQEVFILFARRAAGLRGAGGLASWLHRAAAFRSAARLRAEIRHRGRMKKLEAMDPEAGNWTPELSGAVSERDWALLRPLVDEAVASLPERDRRVILLHYFEQKSYAEVAALTGDSHEAARKRGLRALEKLSRALRRRGAALPVAAVGGGLSAAFQGTVPAALIPLASRAASAGVAAATLAGTGTAWLSAFPLVSFFVMKTSPPVIGAAVLVIAAGSSVLWWSRSHHEPVGSPGAVPADPAPSLSLSSADGARAGNLSPSGGKRAALAAAPAQSMLPPVPPAAGPADPSAKPDPALRERFNRDPRTKKAELRIKALSGGFVQLMNGREQSIRIKNNQIDEATRRSVDASVSPADQAAALAKAESLRGEIKGIREQLDTFRTDSEVWLRSETVIFRDDLLDQIAKEGGADAPLPPPEPESPDAVTVPAFRGAGDLMKEERFDEALTAFTDLARSSTGKVRDQSNWNALLCGMVTGNAAAVESASLSLLRSTPSSACFAMAAKAIQQNEWGGAQIWVNQAYQNQMDSKGQAPQSQDDPHESDTFLSALRALGWAANEGTLLVPPSWEKAGQ